MEYEEGKGDGKLVEDECIRVYTFVRNDYWNDWGVRIADCNLQY